MLLRDMMQSTHITLVINPRKIALLKFLLESYDGLAVLRTIDPKAGKVLLMAGSGAERELEDFISAVQDDLGLVQGLSDPMPWTNSDGIKCLA